ncbi:hypothetical protein RFEPED_0048 [Rickettsia felis str. Pedreira]|uniref:Uncharacterized protein n=1 Tax=Rickettsia felis str. Pedreira TaxID=1359196 RepID=A0A0F3MQH9_RICFI|nr:hypothetical protein RFEPED_0048 [Rickettsia felis str. Pedreira]
MRGAKRRGNPVKIIKKVLKLAFLTGLLRQNLQFFLAMTMQIFTWAIYSIITHV